MKTKFMTFAMMMAMLGITSCSKTDLYDEGKIAEMEAAEAAAAQQKLIAEYEANFIKTFGQINPTQSWDFSNNDVSFNFNASKARTRADESTDIPGPAGSASTGSSWYQVQQSTLDLMTSVFKEGEDHFMAGTYFGMRAPQNAFTILPIFMGQSGGNFRLYLHVKGYSEDILVWSKWDNIEYKNRTNGQWHSLSKGNDNGGKNTVGVAAIQSKPITISGIPKDAEMYFYLKITEEAHNYNHNGDVLSSADGYIKEYTFTESDVKPTQLPGIDPDQQVKCKLIGCEDASTSNTDKDYNDVVFLLYGQPDVPDSYDIEDLEKVEKKRFMIEDLGATDDFDFNDIVVDVIVKSTARIHKNPTTGLPLPGYENPEYTVVGTSAEIKALGGTLDFELKIGSTTWKKSDHCEDVSVMMNTQNPDYEKVLYTIETVNGWNPNANNISVEVYQKNGNLGTTKIGFPETGAVPMMIATDSKIKWAKERARFTFEQFQNAE